MNNKDQYKKIIDYFGYKAQLAKLGEECAELSAVILKYLSNKLFDESCETSGIEERIMSEMVDVRALLDQFEHVYDTEKMAMERNFKLNRTLELIGEKNM